MVELPEILSMIKEHQSWGLAKFPAIVRVLNVVSLIISLLTVASFSEFATLWFSNDRFKTFLAVYAAQLLWLLLVLVVFGPLSLYSLWIYLS